MSLTGPDIESERARRGVAPLILLALFFFSFIAIDVGLGIIAVRTMPGEVVPHSYLQGLHYNQTLAARREQAAMGWRAGVALREIGGAVVVDVVLTDRGGAPLNAMTVDGALHRPASDSQDMALRFEPMGEGVYRARVSGLGEGAWNFTGEARDSGGRVFSFERSITWRMSSR